MKKAMAVRTLIISLFATGLLLYVLVRTSSPKIILLPFLICSLSMAGRSIALLLGKEKLASVFHKLFSLGFLLFWFGFLGFAGFTCIRDKNYGMLLFTVPFWVVGIFIMKNKLLGKTREKDTEPPVSFPFIISTILVGIALLAGIFLLYLGIRRSEFGLLFAGAFFALGALTFVLAWLTIKGYFAHCKLDILGLYMGILVAAIGLCVLIWQGASLGPWTIVPILMTAVGTLQIIKCLRNGK